MRSAVSESIGRPDRPRLEDLGSRADVGIPRLEVCREKRKWKTSLSAELVPGVAQTLELPVGLDCCRQDPEVLRLLVISTVALRQRSDYHLVVLGSS